ncbi:hypothetical protein V8F06_012925 [Rhypophila decipiens]
MPRLFTLAIAALLTLAATQVSADVCGTDSQSPLSFFLSRHQTTSLTCVSTESGQAIACPGGTCCPNSKTGSWTCAPLGSTCCYGTNKADGQGLYCAYGTMCFDSEKCADDKMSTFPATPGSSGKATATTLLADKTVYGGPVPTTPAGGAGGGGGVKGSVTDTPAGVTGTGTGAPGSTETGKPNGAGPSFVGFRLTPAFVAVGLLWTGIALV